MARFFDIIFLPMTENDLPKSGRLLVFLVFFTVLFGLIILASAGIVDGKEKFDSSYYYVINQILNGLIPGVILFYLLSKIDYKYWKKLALPILVGAVFLVILVFVPGVGLALKGAHRWVSVGPISFQPSEFLKLALIIYLAAWFSGRGKKSRKGAYALIPFLLILGFVALLLVLQPDFGTLGLVMAIAMAIYFFSGAKTKHILILILIGGILVGSLAFLSPYRFDRIKTFLNPDQDVLGSSYHIRQALIGIGSGGIFGVGFGASQQKANFLPEPVGDSIFAVLVEELGLVGGLLLISLFIAILITLIYISRQSRDEFGHLFALGIGVWVAGQAFINIAAITGLIPLTGLPLPLVSFGSSSMVAILAGLGIATNISRQS